MVPASPLSLSTNPLTLTDSASASHDTFAPSHLAIAAAVTRSVSAVTNALASSHLPTTASLINPPSTPDSAHALPRTTSWYSAPNTRGTWNLLVTCLITINLCVWTAIHLNIPPKIDTAQPFRKRLWSNYYCRRARWVLLGLLAPELVVYTAWMQWESARQFAKETGTTLTHGFYAGMGAYCIEPEAATTSCDEEHGQSQLYKSIHADCEDRGRGLTKLIPGARHTQRTKEGPSSLYTSILQDYNTNGKSEAASGQESGSFPVSATNSDIPLYLTTLGVWDLVRAGKLSLPTKENITERSKSDLLAKTLVCLQAGYIIVQCISRLASSLPLTFLEINTLGHVLCALVMYTFWLHKPQGLCLSFTLEPDLAKQLRPWHRCYRHLSGGSYMRGVITAQYCNLYKVFWERAKTNVYFDKYDTKNFPSTSSQATQALIQEPRVFEGCPSESAVAALTAEDHILVIHRFDGNVEEQIRIEDNTTLWNLFTEIYILRSKEKLPEYIYRSSQVHCFFSFGHDLQMLASAFRQLLDARIEPIHFLPEYVEEEIPNWPSEGLLSGHTFLPAVAIAISTALYGGLHGAAWRSFFPSVVEKWMWRVSSITIAASGTGFALGMLADKFHWDFSNHKRWSVHWLLNGVLSIVKIDVEDLAYHNMIKIVVLGCLGIICVISRTYLVVEAFISLRRVPIEVYQTPDWTQWIPHL